MKSASEWINYLVRIKFGKQHGAFITEKDITRIQSDAFREAAKITEQRVSYHLADDSVSDTTSATFMFRLENRCACDEACFFTIKFHEKANELEKL